MLLKLTLLAPETPVALKSVALSADQPSPREFPVGACASAREVLRSELVYKRKRNVLSILPAYYGPLFLMAS